VSPRARILAFGSTGLLAVAGGVCAVLIHNLLGELLTISLISIGLGGVVLLLFLEVGLSEDRERARDDERRRQRATQDNGAVPRSPPRSLRSPRRPS
jgi:hypothetical protein